MEIRCASNPKDVKNYDTKRLREEFHISKLFTKDNIRMVYSHIDRIITAGLMPVYQELKLEGGKEESFRNKEDEANKKDSLKYFDPELNGEVMVTELVFEVLEYL